MGVRYYVAEMPLATPGSCFSGCMMASAVLAAACVYLPYLVLQGVEHAQAQFVILFLGGVLLAGAMLWSLVPRARKIRTPGHTAVSSN
jgi:hypothetical protein